MQRNETLYESEAEFAILDEGDKLEDKGWKETDIDITKDELIYKNGEEQGRIFLYSISNLNKDPSEMNIQDDVLSFNFEDMEEKSHLCLIKTESPRELKEAIISATISDVDIRFISPYQEDGRVFIEKQWREGQIVFNGDSIRIFDEEENQVNKIPNEEIFKVETQDSKVKVFYERGEKEYADMLFSPGESISLLKEYYSGEEEMREELSLNPKEEKILMAISSGVAIPSNIEMFTGQERPSIEETLQNLEKVGIIEVVDVEKRYGLTFDGMKLITDIMKK